MRRTTLAIVAVALFISAPVWADGVIIQCPQTSMVVPVNAAPGWSMGGGNAPLSRLFVSTDNSTHAQSGLTCVYAAFAILSRPIPAGMTCTADEARKLFECLPLPPLKNLPPPPSKNKAMTKLH